MKRRWSVLLVGCAVACSLLAGCGSKPQEPVKEQGDGGMSGMPEPVRMKRFCLS